MEILITFLYYLKNSTLFNISILFKKNIMSNSHYHIYAHTIQRVLKVEYGMNYPQHTNEILFFSL